MEKKAFENPPFEIIECTRYYWKEETGDDLVSFDVTIKTECFSSWLPVQFDCVAGYCQQHHPEIGKYYSSVRRNIKGLGPKQSKMFEIMDEEGFDHLPYIHAYIDHQIELEKLYERDQSLQDPTPQQQEMAKKVVAIENHFPSMRESALRNEAFADDLLVYLNDQVLERFPEIFNSDPEFITKLQDKLIGNVRQIREDLDKLAYAASTKNKESKR